MEKKAKFLAITLSSIIIGSTVSLTSVQASTTIKNDTKQETSRKPTAPISRQFSIYCKLSDKALEDVKNYICDCTHKEIVPNTDGVKDALIKNGINRNVANDISFTLLDLAVKDCDNFTNYDMFPERLFKSDKYESKILVLRDEHDRFSLVVGDPTIKDYSTYGILTSRDLVNLQKTIKSEPKREGESSRDYAERMIIKSDMVQDKAMIEKIADVISACTDNSNSVLKECIELNEYFVVILSDDNEKVLIARRAR